MRERRRGAMRGRYQRLGDWIVCSLRAAAMHFPSLIIASVVVYCLSVAVFRTPASVVSEEMHNPLRREWSTADAAIFAARVHLPMFTLPGQDQWEPAKTIVTVRRVPVLVRYDAYAMVISLLSYTLIPLVLGGIASTWLRRGRHAA